jgi:hypothetical protein
VLALSACLGAPYDLADDNPASAKAAEGAVAMPTAFDAYRSAEDFATRAAEERGLRSAGHSGHAHGGVR